LPEVKEIGENWLIGCTTLKEFTLPKGSLPEVKEIGENWLSGCTTLKEFILHPQCLRKLKKIGQSRLLVERAAPETSILPEGSLPELKETGKDSLSEFDALKIFALQPSTLSNLEIISSGWGSETPTIEIALTSESEPMKKVYGAHAQAAGAEVEVKEGETEKPTNRVYMDTEIAEGSGSTHGVAVTGCREKSHGWIMEVKEALGLMHL